MTQSNLMRYEDILAIQPTVEDFVKTLDGTYRAHATDALVVALLLVQLDLGRSDITKPSYGQQLLAGDYGVAYNAACTVFETLFEGKLRCGGNGHHRAQAFSAYMRSHLKPIHDAADEYA